MAILVLAYSIGHHSGGHINCAVTFSLVLGGQVDCMYTSNILRRSKLPSLGPY
jgi:glycerol uptake facilitator-like aquaporin